MKTGWGWMGLALGLGVLAVLAGLGSAEGQATTGGPDLGNWQWATNLAPAGPNTPVHAFVDISGNGTPIVFSFSADDGQMTIPLGFSITFYDITTSQVRVSANGYLCMQTTSCSNLYTYSSPSTFSPNHFVSAFHKDLDCRNAACVARYTTWGDAPNRVVVVMVKSSACWSYVSSSCNLSYEYKVFEQGYVEVHYGSLFDPATFGNAIRAGTEGRTSSGTAVGLSAFVGSPNAAATSLANKAIRYFTTGGPPPPPPPCVSGGPVNDCFSGIVAVPVSPGTATGSNVNAGTEAGEPQPSCCSSAQRSIWYSWTPAVTGQATVSTCGSSFDTVLAVYTGAAITGLTQVASNDDSCGLSSSVTFPCTAGTPYRIQVMGYGGSQGSVSLSAMCVLPCQMPANDCFGTATPITGNNAYVSQSTVGATTEAGEPMPGFTTVSKTVWFDWTPATNGFATVTTCAVAPNPASSYDTVIGVYTGAVLTGLSLVTSNDQACGNQSTVSFPCTAGTTYRIQVGSWLSTAAGNLRITFACIPPCTQPANDCFADATPLTGSWHNLTQSTVGAVTEPGEPMPGYTVGRTVWFAWTPPTSGLATVTTCRVGPNPPATFDTVIGVYSGTALPSLSLLTSNDQACSNQSTVSFPCSAGTTYRIQVGSWSSSGAGTLNLHLRCAPPCTLPPNDCFAVPQAVALPTVAPFLHGVDTTFATMEAGEPTPPCCSSPRNSVWYEFLALGAGTGIARTCGSSYDTVLTVYTGPALTGLTRLAYNDDACSFGSQVTFTCVPGTLYRMQVTGYAGASGTLAFSFTGCPQDADLDAVPDYLDNCVLSPNADQADLDLDGMGNACDPDLDGDGAGNEVDNCPLQPNTDQADPDGDGLGRPCDATPFPGAYAGTGAVPKASRDPTAPVAAFGLERPACGPGTVYLDGTPSRDSDGRVVRWSWAFADGRAAEGRVAAIGLEEGEHELILTVWDDDGQSHTVGRQVKLEACP